MDQFSFPVYPGNAHFISQGPFQPTADRACEACNKKKTKCGKELPICGLCSRTNHECIYPTSRKRPSRHDHDGKTKIHKINGNIDRLLEILETSPNKNPKGLSADSESNRHVSPNLSNASQTDHDGATSLVTPGQTPPHAIHLQNLDGTKAKDAQDASGCSISYDLAMHLLEVYFDKVQPWLGIFHKPTFMEWSKKVLSKEESALQGLETCDTMIFTGMFAMAARFSDRKEFQATPPRDRGEAFGKESRRCFKIIEDFDEVSIPILQASLLLAFYEYGAGRSQRARTVALLCIRACYDLRLHEIDMGDENENCSPSEWIDLELQRRVFWSTWECDVFGTILKRRPFGIDWRHIRVFLPVSDEAWFAGEKVQSASFIFGPECWKTLAGDVPNQDGRAWMLLSKSMIAWLCDLALLKDGVTKERKANIESNVSCFRLAMPDSFSLSAVALQDPGVSFVHKNYSIAANIYLCASSFTAAQIPIVDDTEPHTQDQIDAEETIQYRNRGLELCQILKKWPPECVLYASPNLACAMLTFNESLVRLVPPNELDPTYHDLSELILSKFAERWTIAALLVRIRDLTHHPERVSSDDPTNAKLLREYPAYFNKVAIARDRRKKLRGLSEFYRDNSSNAQEKASTQHNPVQMQHPSSQVTPAHSVTRTSDLMDPTYLDTFSNTSASPVSLDVSLLDAPTTSAFNSTSNPNVNASPQDFDALFSGFLQEPLWQDFHLTSFLP